MKIMKLALRFWISLTSVFSFLVAWAMLAHSPKPVQAKTISEPSSPSQVTPLPTLAPLPPMNLGGGNSGGSTFQLPAVTVQQPPPPPVTVFSQAPVFTTGGS